jgi:hypothetical protein
MKSFVKIVLLTFILTSLYSCGSGDEEKQKIKDETTLVAQKLEETRLKVEQERLIIEEEKLAIEDALRREKMAEIARLERDFPEYT